MTEHDKDLEAYLRGDARLSRAYREAGGQQAPPHLDEAIIARARAELQRKPSWNRTLAPVALAATVVLGVNLAWNLYESEPAPQGSAAPDQRVAAPPQARQRAAADMASTQEERIAAAPVVSSAPPPAPEVREAKPKAKMESRLGDAAEAMGADPARVSAGAPPSAALSAEADSASQPRKAPRAPSPDAGKEIERLIAWVHGLEATEFIVDGESFTAPQAAVYLRIQWREAAERVHTVEDFIEKCARRSPASGEPYRFRFPDGHVRDVADVLREQAR